MAPMVTYSNWPLSGMMNEAAGTAARPPASPPLPPVSGCCSGLPAAAVPPPLKRNDRSTAVTSPCTVVRSKVDMTAGLLTTTEASPLADAAPAMARPWALALFSFNWKAAALAWPQASAPAMPSANAEIRVMFFANSMGMSTPGTWEDCLRRSEDGCPPSTTCRNPLPTIRRRIAV